MMFADVVHLDTTRSAEGKPVVFGAECRASSWAGCPNAGRCQLLAYCTALDMPRAWVV